MKNIIFDFGNVIIDVDTESIKKKLWETGIHDLSALDKHFRNTGIYTGIETGAVSSEKFREEIRKFIPGDISDLEIDKAWNAVIGEITPERFILLEKLKRNYRTFLLSNTNQIHYDHYTEYCCREFKVELQDLFEKAYFSFRMGLRKPDPQIFLKILDENHLNPEETLFIDDAPENIEAARKLNIRAYQLNEGIDLTDLFDDRLGFKAF